MADFVYKGVIGSTTPEHKRFDVASGAAASIDIGDIVAVANGYAAKISNGGGTGGQLLGLATSVSTDTVAAAGVVDVMFHPNGLVVQGVATTAANLLIGVVYDKVTLDVAAGVIRVDEDDAGNGNVLIYEIDSDSATTGIVRVALPFQLWTS